MSVKKPNPAAFLSYVHTDDKYGQVSTLRERLSDEVRVRIGIEFPICQNRDNLKWGQNRRGRLRVRAQSAARRAASLRREPKGC